MKREAKSKVGDRVLVECVGLPGKFEERTVAGVSFSEDFGEHVYSVGIHWPEGEFMPCESHLRPLTAREKGDR